MLSILTSYYLLVMCDIRDMNIYRDINGHDMI